jgi:transcriptional regulator with XRE-family HTH domain
MTAVAKKKDIDPSFGRRLRYLRDQAGMTLSQVSQATGIAVSSVGRLERGEREPGWETVRKLADALGVTPSDFLPSDRPKA